MTPNWFVGFPVDLGGYHARLSSAPRRVRVFAPSDTHLTVAFFGHVDEARARDAFEACPEPTLPPTDLRFERYALLGAARAPSAIALVAGGDGATAVASCVARLRGPLLHAAGAPPDTRPPLPHVTVARLQRKATTEERRVARAWVDGLPLPSYPSRVLELALYTWAPDRASRLFEVVARRPLRPSS